MRLESDLYVLKIKLINKLTITEQIYTYLPPCVKTLKNFNTIRHSSFSQLFRAPYLNQTLKPNFSRTTGPKLKVKLYSDRAKLAL